MNASTTSAQHTAQRTKRRPYRDLDSLLEEEEELAKVGLAHSARHLIDDASTALDQRVRRHPIGTTLLSAAAVWLLVGRRRRARLPGQPPKQHVILPLLVRFASSTVVGAVLGRAARTKGSRYFPF